MADFSAKVVVITGASEGIGRALALALAPQGAKLALAARNVERLESLRAECLAAGAGAALVIPTDVTDSEACRALIETTAQELGGIDLLINNAGATMWTTLEECEDLGLFERLMKLNYLGSVYPTYFALPYLKKGPGKILAMSSVAGLTGVPTRTGYSASKHAVFGFFDSLRVEVADYGITVTVAAPDFVLSEIHRRATGKDGKPLGTSPLDEDKIMTAEECARICLDAVARGDRLVLTSSRGRLARWLKLLAPGLMDKLAAKAIRDKK